MYSEKFKERVRAAYDSDDKQLDNWLEAENTLMTEGDIALGQYLMMGAEKYSVTENDIANATDVQMLKLLQGKAQMIVKRRQLFEYWLTGHSHNALTPAEQ
jgi:hypothetical protein